MSVMNVVGLTLMKVNMNKMQIFVNVLRMVNMDLSKEELQLIYLGLHTITTSYVIRGDLEGMFLNLLDKVSIEIDKKSEFYYKIFTC